MVKIALQFSALSVGDVRILVQDVDHPRGLWKVCKSRASNQGGLIAK
jgi:hypothetical protein